MGGMSMADLSPLAADMRAQDPDRYLATLFAPADIRNALFALYAFDHEIAKVRRVVREPMAGLIRLQWWRDALHGIETGTILAHPVVQGLGDAIARQGLDRRLLERAIDARERELEEEPPEEFGAFEQHLMATNSGIVRAALMLLGGEDDPKTLTVAEPLGQSLGLLEKFRMLSVAHDGMPCWLPKALLLQHGLTEQAPEEAGRDKIKAVQEALAARAREHLASARRNRTQIPRKVLPAFFPGTLASVRLRDIHRSQERPAIAVAPFRLLWHWLRGSF